MPVVEEEEEAEFFVEEGAEFFVEVVLLLLHLLFCTGTMDNPGIEAYEGTMF